MINTMSNVCALWPRALAVMVLVLVSCEGLKSRAPSAWPPSALKRAEVTLSNLTFDEKIALVSGQNGRDEFTIRLSCGSPSRGEHDTSSWGPGLSSI